MSQETDKTLSVDDMLAADDIEYATVGVPEWKGIVKLASIDAGAMVNFAESSRNGGSHDATIRLVVQSIIDDEGNRVPEDQIDAKIELFKRKNVKVMNRLVDAALKLNGVTVRSQVEIKNELSGAPIDASPSVLR